jgi:imidazolonepropionase-like amidohydrolase
MPISRAAVMLDREGEIGIVAPGAFADIIAVPGDPLKDITVLKKVEFVMKDGQVYRGK